MKTQISKLIMKISRKQVTELTKEVKESLAMEFASVKKETFSAAQLWNIQRQFIGISQRRRDSI